LNKRAGTESISERELTPPYARLLFRFIRPFPNFDLFFVKSLRRRAVQKLCLRPGDRVLDAGCGPGGSFPYLVEAVSPSGEVVAVEISPKMALSARKRVEKNGWANLRVVQGDARTVNLEGSFDAVLMLGAPDVYASSEALDNLGRYLKNDARVVAFGAKLSRRWFGRLLNALFRSMFSKSTFASTPGLEYEPWQTLERGLGALMVEELFFDWMFLAWGRRKT